MANTVPTLTGLTASVTFNENTVNAAPQIIDGDVTFTDPDNNFNGGALTVSGHLAEDTVSIRNQGNGAGQIGFSGGNVSFGGTVIGAATGGGAGATLTVTFNASATSAAIDALIQNLTYANASDAPTASRTLSIVLTDNVSGVFSQQFVPPNPFDGIDVGSYSAPTFADLDGDGDLDVVAGERSGILNYFKNTGSPTAPAFIEQTGPVNPLNGVNLGQVSVSALIDLDGDGDLDLVGGAKYAGMIDYFQNFGSATAPVFGVPPAGGNPFDGIEVGNERFAPAFGDVDGDGDLDMLVGPADRSLVLAALDLGATPWQAFWRVTFPITLSGAVSGAALVFIPVSGEYLIPHFIGDGKVSVAGTLVMEWFDHRHWPYAAACAAWLAAVVLVPIGVSLAWKSRELAATK